MKKTSTFTTDEKWGSYWEFELNKFIEPYFNLYLNKQGKFISFTTLRSSDIYPNKKSEWWRYDTLYNLYNQENSSPEKQIKFEIKADKFDNTGNICIEKKCSKKFSGVFHTEADYFIYYMPRYTEDNLYLFKPKELSVYLDMTFNHYLRYVGDGGRSYSYIINKSEFDQKIIDNKIGKIFTFNLPIPPEFGVDKFISNNTRASFDYSGINKYNNSIDF